MNRLNRRNVAWALLVCGCLTGTAHAQYGYPDARTGPAVTIVPENGRIQADPYAAQSESSARRSDAYNLDADPRYRAPSPTPRTRPSTNGAFRPYPLSGETEPAGEPRRLTRRPGEQYRMAAAPRLTANYQDAPPRVARRAAEDDSLPPPPETLPRAQPRSIVPKSDRPEEITPIHEPAPEQGYYEGEYFENEYGGNCDCEYDECNDDCDYDPLAFFRLLARWSKNLTVNVGVQGFKSTFDAGRQANFGFHEGVNWGIPIMPWWDIGAQIGFQVTQSDFDEGSASTADRRQSFFTFGLFHRAGPCGGLQFGVAFDHLRDEYYIEHELSQMRAEVSLVGSRNHEVGFWGAFGLGGETYHTNRFNAPIITEPLDMYALFYRHRFCDGGTIRIWGGFTGQQDGMLGGDFQVPVSRYLAVQSSFNYVIPAEESREAWNLGIQLVVYPGGRARCGERSLYRPIFDVADNGTFITDIR